MVKRQIIAILVTIGICASASISRSATTTASLTANTNIAARASLVLGGASIDFPDADPNSVASIAASQNPVNVTARVRTGTSSVATLQVQAAGDLVSGTDTIPVGNVSWTSTGSGFAAGTMNKTTAQPVGSWSGPGSRAGTISYFLANSWNYATGSYTVTITYTLTAP